MFLISLCSLPPHSALSHTHTPPPALPIIIIVFSSPNLWGDILGKMRQVYMKCKLVM